MYPSGEHTPSVGCLRAGVAVVNTLTLVPSSRVRTKSPSHPSSAINQFLFICVHYLECMTVYHLSTGNLMAMFFTDTISWCQSINPPGLGSRLSTCWPTKWPNNWRCSQHTSVDQTPTPCVPVASPGFKPKGRVGRADTPARAKRGGVA